LAWNPFLSGSVGGLLMLQFQTIWIGFSPIAKRPKALQLVDPDVTCMYAVMDEQWWLEFER
jgi:hypothetical protein